MKVSCNLFQLNLSLLVHDPHLSILMLNDLESNILTSNILELLLFLLECGLFDLGMDYYVKVGR